ncbi:MAG TPA: transporter substrate-binding domain-containing protein [Microbacteriaceae bacterium]|nr:transporter substrate-binding domain-containing protein [Microbacteriaceae bacterium]
MIMVAVLIAAGSAVAIVLREQPAAQVRPVLVLSGEWAPYSGPDLDGGGPAIRILTDVLEQSGYSPTVQYTTWAAIEDRLVSGAVFGGFPLASSESRRSELLLSDPLIEFEYVLFIRASDASTAGAATLDGLRAGGVAGYDYWPELEDATAIQRFPTTFAGLQALADGEIDVFAEGRLAGWAAAGDPDNNLDANAFAVLERSAAWARSTESLVFAMPRRPGNEAVLDQINAAISAYRGGTEHAKHLALLHDGPAQLVTLDAATGSTVPLRDVSGAIVGMTPSGTAARVLAWPPRSAQGTPSSDDALTEVKLIDGPAPGGVYFVAVEDLRMAAT